MHSHVAEQLVKIATSQRLHTLTEAASVIGVSVRLDTRDLSSEALLVSHERRVLQRLVQAREQIEVRDELAQTCVCVCMCMHACACVCMRVHACACVCMRMHACMCKYRCDTQTFLEARCHWREALEPHPAVHVLVREHLQVKSSQAKPSQSQAKSSRVESSRVESSRAEPSRAESCRVVSCRVVWSQVKRCSHIQQRKPTWAACIAVSPGRSPTDSMPRSTGGGRTTFSVVPSTSDASTSGRRRTLG